MSDQNITYKQPLLETPFIPKQVKFAMPMIGIDGQVIK